MKNLKAISLVIFFFCMSIFSKTFGQTLKYDSLEKKYIIQEIIICDSTLSKKQIYELSKSWIAKSFKGIDNNIILDDPEQKQITTTCVLRTNVPTAICQTQCKFEFKLTIDVKEGKIRYTVENISHLAPNYVTTLENTIYKKKILQQIFDELEYQIKQKVDILIATLRDKQKSDW